MNGLRARVARRTSGAALVLGAEGFIGTHLTIELRRLGVLVAELPGYLGDAMPSDTFAARLADVVRIHRPTEVFNLIGSGTPQGRLDLDYHIRKNVASATAVTRGLQRARFRGRLIFASTGSVYGNTSAPATEEATTLPVTAFAEAKLIAETNLREAFPNLIVARLFQVFGEGQRKLVVYELMRRIIHEAGPVRIESRGDESRDFVYVGEAVAALIFLAYSDGDVRNGETFNVASGMPMTIATLARQLVALHGEPDRRICLSSLAPANSLTSSIGDSTKLSKLGYQVAAASTSHLRRTLRWVANDV